MIKYYRQYFSLSFILWFERFKEKNLLIFISILPKYLKYRIAIDVIAHATVGEYSEVEVPELKAMDAIACYEKDFLRKS